MLLAYCSHRIRDLLQVSVRLLSCLQPPFHLPFPSWRTSASTPSIYRCASRTDRLPTRCAARVRPEVGLSRSFPTSFVFNAFLAPRLQAVCRWPGTVSCENHSSSSAEIYEQRRRKYTSRVGEIRTISNGTSRHACSHGSDGYSHMFSQSTQPECTPKPVACEDVTPGILLNCPQIWGRTHGHSIAYIRHTRWVPSRWAVRAYITQSYVIKTLTIAISRRHIAYRTPPTRGERRFATCIVRIPACGPSLALRALTRAGPVTSAGRPPAGPMTQRRPADGERQRFPSSFRRGHNH